MDSETDVRDGQKPDTGKRIRMVEVPIASITGYDKDVAKIASVIEAAGVPWFLRNNQGPVAGTGRPPAASLSHHALEALLLIQPIVVTRVGSQEKYLCVAGILTLVLARCLNPLGTKRIQVQLLPRRTSRDKKRTLAYADLLAKPALSAHGWDNPQALASIWERLIGEDKRMLEQIMPSAGTKRGFVRLRGVAFSTMFHAKQGAGSGESDDGHQ